MELAQLKYFKTIAKTGKITAAAQELFLTPPALSTSIVRLEKELGVPLFDRTGNRIRLNPQGELFLKHVDEVFDTLDRARQELRKDLLRRHQQVTLATTGSTLWLDLITAFSQAHPTLTLACVSTVLSAIEALFDQYTFLLSEAEDIPASCAPTLDSLFLFQDEPAILIHPDHPLAVCDRVTVSMLQGENLLLPAQGTPRRERLIRLLEYGGINTDTATSSTYIIFRNMVQENMGIAFTTMHAHHFNLGDLRVIPLQNDLSPWLMSLYWRRDHNLTPAELTFRDFAAHYFQH